MRTDERRAKLRVFIRVGLFAIATALSAAALIQIRSELIDSRNTQKELESRESKLADLKRSNDKLVALGSLRAQHHATALKNVEYVTSFYQLCRESSDLPLLKTDFIISESDALNVVRGDLFAFSVPSGSHTLQLSIEPTYQGGTGERPPTKLVKFPLLPSAGYVVRIYPVVEDESGKSKVFVDLTSNNAIFTAVRRALPIFIRKPDDFSFDAIISPMHFDLRKILETRGDFKNLTYPNCLTHMGAYSSDLQQGLQLRSCYLTSSDNTNMEIRLSIISDSKPCVTSSSARFSGAVSGRLVPYTGNGRIYVRP